MRAPKRHHSSVLRFNQDSTASQTCGSVLILLLAWMTSSSKALERLGVWSCGFLLLVLSQGSSSAAESKEGIWLEGTGIQVRMDALWPNLVAVTARQSAPKSAGIRDIQTVEVMVSGPQFLRQLRHAILKARIQRLLPTSSECLPHSESFEVQLRRLEHSLKFLRLEVAQLQLKRALDGLSCAREIIDAQAFAELKYLTGLLQFYQSGDPRRPFAEALALLPEYVPREDYGRSIRSALDSARELALGLDPVRLTLSPRALGDLNLWINGHPQSSGDLELHAGTHIFQLRDADGTFLSSWLMTLAPAPGLPIALLPLALEPPDEEWLKRALRNAVRSRGASGELHAALLNLLESGNHPWMVLVAAGENGREAHALWLLNDGTQSAGAGRCTVAPFCEARSPALTVIGKVLLASSVAGTGVFGVADATGRFGKFSSDESRQSFHNARTAGLAGMLVGLTGSAIVLSYNWRVPGRWYGGEKHLSEARSQLKMSAGAASSGLALEVTW